MENKEVTPVATPPLPAQALFVTSHWPTCRLIPGKEISLDQSGLAPGLHGAGVAAMAVSPGEEGGPWVQSGSARGKEEAMDFVLGARVPPKVKSC